MKKGTTLLRTLLLVLLGTMLGTMSVSAQEAYAVYTSNNTTLTFYYDSDRSTHTLSTETVYNLPTGNTQPAWYTDGTYANVTKVSFTSSFSSAQPTSTSYWFYHMSNLTSISNLRYLNTSSVTSMNQMFAYCSGLTSLDLSNFDTGKVTTMQSMFWECTGLTSINMNNFNTEKVTTMYGMFKGCSALTTLDIRYFKTPVLANIQQMFFGCSNLTTIYAGHGWTYSGNDSQVFNNSSKLVGGEGTKYNPSYLGASYARVDGGTSSPGYFTRVPYVVWDSSAKSLTFYDDGKGSEKTGVIYNLNGPNTRPGWDTNDDVTNRSVTKVVFDPSFANARPNSTYLWFAGMEKLTTITGIKYLNTSQVTNMSYMFSGCKLLTFIDVRHFDTSKATNMYCMFYSCIGLTRLDLTSFNTHNVTNMGGMFEQCNNLKTIYVGENWSTAAVSTSSDMFKGCTSLVGQKGTSCNGTNNITHTYARVDDPDNGNPGYLTKVPMPYAVYANGTLTFYCDGKRNEKAGTTYNLNLGNEETEWYSNRTNVTKVVFDPSFAVARPYTTHGWFKYHAHITSFTGMEYLNTSEVTDMGSMFVNCVEMETFDLSNFDTRNVTDMQNMFQGCTGLTTLDLSTFDTESLVDMDYMFYDCTNLTTIIVDNKWNAETVGSGNVMFYNCSKLTGGAGTTYNASHNDKTYARIDKGPSSTVPGYLTAATKPYAVYNSSTATLTFYCDGSWYTRIGGTGYSLNVGNNAPAWFTDGTRTNVTTVVFDASFADARPTSTCLWFSNMRNLTTINGIEYLNTSSVTNMSEMFVLCEKLTSIDLSHFDTRNVADMGYMFHSCIALKSLDLSSFNTQLVTDTRYMFCNCSALTTIYASDDWDVSHVTLSGSMFEGCANLKGGNGTVYDAEHIDKSYAIVDGTNGLLGYLSYKPYVVYNSSTTTLTFYCDGMQGNHVSETETVYDLNEGSTSPAWFTDNTYANVTKVVFNSSFVLARPTTTYRWFYRMSKLTNIMGIENLYTFEVTNMAAMFLSCSKLEELDVSHFDTQKVTSMSAMFYGCSKLTSLDLSGFNTSNVTEMYSMFQYCDLLESLDLRGWNTANVTTMSQLFLRCGSLTTLDLSSFDTHEVTSMSYMFQDCSNLTTIYVDCNWNTDKYTSSNGVTSLFKNCTSLVGMNGTTCDGENNLSKEYARVDGGPDSDTPGYLSYKPYVVYDNSNTTLTFYCDGQLSTHTAETETVYDLNKGYEQTAWYLDGKYSSVQTVIFDPSFANARPTTTKDWFVAMFDLTSIEGMENLNTSEVTNMKDMFSLCEKLESVDVSGFDTRKVTTMNGLFNECNSLQSVDLSGFNTSNVTDMQQMFYRCTALTTLDLTSFNTENVTLTPWMFYGCDHLKTVYVSDGFKVENVGQHTCMFEGCTSIVGGNGTTYDASYIDKEYAIIDGINGNPGYFTAKPYAVYNLDTQLLTLYNDGKPNEKTGKKFYLNAGNSMPGWVEVRTDIKKVVFHESFASARPTSTYYWFGEMPNLQEIEGLELLNTSEVTNMEAMFGNYHKAGELDLSHFDTHKVTSMKSMFWGCQNITTIYVSNAWNTNNVTDGWGMFYNCRNLVGGMGTEWKEDNYDYQDLVYAHIDEGTDNPGYLSLAPTEAYAVFANYTLTFYNDGKPNEKEGVVYCLPEPNAVPRYNIKGFTKAVFDSSFASARPTSTNSWFIGCSRLAEIEGLENLNTSEVTDMNCMFAGCTGLTSLDLSHFNTEKVTDMGSMFNICSSLKTIYVGDGWSTSSLTNNYSLFTGCTALVGGAGTVFAPNHIGSDYAHIDGGAGNPGYFTQGPAYALIGDVNGDKQVNVADVTALVNMLKSGNVVYNEVADVDGDGSITNIDVKALVYNILGSYALMYVEDVFTITGRGTVATGQILKGMFRTGQTAVLRSISDAIADVEFTISGIEMTHQTVDVAVAGDNVGILVPVDKANVQRGDVLTIKNNPELRHSKTMKGTLYVLTKEEGGRHTPFFVNYSPQMYVAGGIFTVKCTDLGTVNGQALDMVMPGSTSENVVIEVIEDGKTPYTYPGQVVYLREGGQTIGRLTITE